MQSKQKSNSVITHEVAGNAITFNVRGAGTVTFDLATVNEAILQRAAIHGFIQRISDAAAISRDTETGKPASPQDKLDAMKRLVEHYESSTPEWSRVSAGGGTRGGMLFEALCEMYPQKSPEEVKTWLEGVSKADQAKMRTSKRVADKIGEIRARKGLDVEADAHAEELLEGLLGEEA